MGRPLLRPHLRPAGFESFNQLSKALYQDYQFRRLSDLPLQRSFSAYLGKLDRGDDGWFRLRPEVLQLVAARLGVPTSSLLPEPTAEESPPRDETGLMEGSPAVASLYKELRTLGVRDDVCRVLGAFELRLRDEFERLRRGQ